MMESLTEAIARSMIERNEPNAIAREMVDEKVKALISHLKDGSCIYIRNIYKDIPEFEMQNLESIEIFIKEGHTEKAVVISIRDIEKAFKLLRFDCQNPVDFKTASDAIHEAFHGLPNRCPYFKTADEGIVFKVNI